MRTKSFLGWTAAIVVAGSAGCGGPVAETCRGASDCPSGYVCFDAVCRRAVDGGARDGSLDGTVTIVDASVAHESSVDTSVDAPLGPSCTTTADCVSDSHCVAGACRAWMPAEYDDACVRTTTPGPVIPRIQCTWDGPASDDPLAGANRILHTPLVANFHITQNPDQPASPSIVIIGDGTYAEGPPRGCSAAGALRIIDGASCAEVGRAVDAGDRLLSPVTPVIGDLDNDGQPEIVAAHADGGLIAFDVAPSGAVTRRWRSADTWGYESCQWGGLAMVDLDDDGVPEILYEGAAWSATGTQVATIAGWNRVGTGSPMTAGDYDRDGKVEVVGGDAVWEFDTATRAFVVQTAPRTQTNGVVIPAGNGYNAIADFGVLAGEAEGVPEIVTVYAGVVYVTSLNGPPIAAYAAGTASAGSGGPPTIANFDGDPAREIGVAFGDSYHVFDVATGTRLWQTPSQDRSSTRTGSSVFDFNGDGAAEVVYGDECYVRVYEGGTGTVLFSQPHFSSTWTENPIVADVDGDGASEIVLSSSNACIPTYCPTLDPIDPGLRCRGDSDCPGGPCTDGFCRCTDDSQCTARFGAGSYGCHPPLAGTAGTGNVCRSVHIDCPAGLRVYYDPDWAGTRGIWNQHAYSVTNIDDQGRVPRTTSAMPNWTDPTLNNFRQNAQGSLRDRPSADLTARDLVAFCGPRDPDSGVATTDLSAVVCNRGQVPSDAQVEVIFRRTAGAELCRLRTMRPLAPGVCETVTCTADVAAQGEFEAVVDPDAVVSECQEGNNESSGMANCVT